METKLSVDGMHCNSCKGLIKMELEENGFEDKIVSLELGEDNKGLLTLTDLSEEEKTKAIELVNNMDQYSVV